MTPLTSPVSARSAQSGGLQPCGLQPDTGAPWWRFPIVWLVVGGPLVVVVASLFMVGIAVRHVDPVIDVASSTSTPAHVPALQGRNRAADNALRPADH